MTKQDYIEFAAMIKGLKGEIPETYRDKFTIETGHIFARDNVRFDKSRFYAAAEVGKHYCWACDHTTVLENFEVEDQDAPNGLRYKCMICGRPGMPNYGTAPPPNVSKPTEELFKEEVKDKEVDKATLGSALDKLRDGFKPRKGFPAKRVETEIEGYIEKYGKDKPLVDKFFQV